MKTTISSDLFSQILCCKHQWQFYILYTDIQNQKVNCVAEKEKELF